LFGNNVNAKLGGIGYICLYLAGAVFSGGGHIVLGSLYGSTGPAVPVLGASGAVAAITGAYLVLFPQTLITVFYWLLFFIGTFEISALYFIAFKLIFWDNMLERGLPNIAYDAHLSGYAFGILATLGMLAAGLTSSSSFDLWAMIKATESSAAVSRCCLEWLRPICRPDNDKTDKGKRSKKNTG